jgi:hypothetical protein
LVKSTPPGAEVWIDGVKKNGVTPLTLSDLTADAHLLVVSKGKSRYRAMVQVKPDEFTTVTATLQQVGGRLSVITSPPEAKVKLNGREMGQTPTIIRGVSPGSHVLEIQKDGFVTERKTIKLVTATAEHSVDIKLRLAGTLLVLSDPAGAAVSLDGKAAGQTPLTAQVAPGKHTVRLELSGRKTARRDVEVVVDRKVGVSVQLELSVQEKERQAEATRLRAETLAKRRTKSIWAFSSLALGVGLAVGAGVLYGVSA